MATRLFRRWGRPCAAMGGWVHFVERVPVVGARQVAGGARQVAGARQVQEPKAAKLRWRAMRDPKLEDLPRPVWDGTMSQEEVEEVSGRLEWAEIEQVRRYLPDPEDDFPFVDPVIEAREAKLLRIYYKLADDLTTLQGKEAPTTGDRKLLYDFIHARDTFQAAYKDRVRAAYRSMDGPLLDEGPFPIDWNASANLWAEATCNVLEEVNAELEQEIKMLQENRTAEVAYLL